jgi:ADP-ribose pyrophosphatase
LAAWKTLERKTILKQGKWLTVESHTVEVPDGRVIPDWPWIITPDYINVLAVTDEGKFLCFRQEKYGLEGDSLAPVGGYIEPGEDPEEAAKRELLEETGYEADEWVNLGSFLVGPNRGICTGNLFLARNAKYVTEPDSDDLEEQQLLHLSLLELEEALVNGEFKVMAWAANIAFAILYLGKERKE